MACGKIKLIASRNQKISLNFIAENFRKINFMSSDIALHSNHTNNTEQNAKLNGENQTQFDKQLTPKTRKVQLIRK